MNYQIGAQNTQDGKSFFLGLKIHHSLSCSAPAQEKKSISLKL
jgi:hypothetical protein